jgi:hypothetical protein
MDVLVLGDYIIEKAPNANSTAPEASNFLAVRP